MAILTSAASGSAPIVMMELKSAPSMPIGHSNFLIPFTGFDTWNPTTGSGPPNSFTVHWTLASATEAAFVDLMWSLIDSSCFTHSPSLLDAMELPPSTCATVKPHHCVRNSAEPIPSHTSRALKFWITPVSISLDITNSWHVARWNHEPISSHIPLTHGIPWYPFPFPHLQPLFLALSSARPSAWFCVSRSASSGNRGWSQDRTSGTSWGWGEPYKSSRVRKLNLKLDNNHCYSLCISWEHSYETARWVRNMVFLLAMAFCWGIIFVFWRYYCQYVSDQGQRQYPVATGQS